MDIQSIVMSLIKQNTNPFINNLINLAQKGDIKELERIGNNYCKERNLNFEEELEKLKKNPMQFLGR